jgi:hypothetical protein
MKGEMRVICEVCPQEAYIQKLSNYYRCRHYAGINPETGKAKFYYHQQSKDYAETQLALMEKQGNLEQQLLNNRTMLTNQISKIQVLFQAVVVQFG